MPSPGKFGIRLCFDNGFGRNYETPGAKTGSAARAELTGTEAVREFAMATRTPQLEWMLLKS